MRRLVDVFVIATANSLDVSQEGLEVRINIYINTEKLLLEPRTANLDGQDCLRIRSGPGFPLSATVLIG